MRMYFIPKQCVPILHLGMKKPLQDRCPSFTYPGVCFYFQYCVRQNECVEQCGALLDASSELKWRERKFKEQK